MKAKVDLRIPVIIILTIILSIMCYFYFKEDSNTSFGNMNFDFSQMNDRFNNNSISNINSKKTILTTTCEVKSALTESIDLHATYYLKESYVSTNEQLKSGEKILKYTNSKYLKAPYDCIVTDINIPSEKGQCTNEHYIEISSTNNLQVQFRIDETKLDSIKIGDEATIEIAAYEGKVLTGYVTKISSTASNGRFTVTVEFENDGEVLLGMTATVTI